MAAGMNATDRNAMDSNAMLLGVFPQINRVAVRIPPFWPDDPEMWFAQVEN